MTNATAAQAKDYKFNTAREYQDCVEWSIELKGACYGTLGRQSGFAFDDEWWVETFAFGYVCLPSGISYTAAKGYAVAIAQGTPPGFLF